MDAAARALVTRQLRDHGWSYVNVDDGWQGVRGGPFNAIQPNRKFPDIAGLADEIHACGLKFGLYSTPWRTSYYAHIGSSADHADGTYDWIQAGQHTDVFRYRFVRTRSWLSAYSWLEPLGRRFEKKRLKKANDRLRTFGKFSFVREDAQQWGAWGVDYLKYDWDPTDLPHIIEMRNALRATGRDIVYSLANDVDLTLAPKLIGTANVWRGTIDVRDKWRDLEVGFRIGSWAPFTGPGHYNDPDMLVIGRIGWDTPRPTKLTSDEQYTQVSLWCLLAAPLFLGCDLDQLDPFTLSLITNDEVLAIDQDALCKQGTQVAGSGHLVAYAKPLEDGSWAVGLFNRGTTRARVAVKWSDLGRAGSQKVRDLWRQKDLGVFPDGFAADVAPHGVVLIRVSRKNSRGSL
ncbi:MAG: glycoside hydrolase family 27 protein [Chthoniobacterales bacterium]